MTMQQIQKKFNVNVIKTRSSRHNFIRYRAYLKGDGTVQKLTEVAEAHNLVTLAVRIEKFLSK